MSRRQPLTLEAAWRECDRLELEVEYQKARAAYFKCAPEIEHDPEGVRALADEVLRLTRARNAPSGNA